MDRERRIEDNEARTAELLAEIEARRAQRQAREEQGLTRDWEAPEKVMRITFADTEQHRVTAWLQRDLHETRTDTMDAETQKGWDAWCQRHIANALQSVRAGMEGLAEEAGEATGKAQREINDLRKEVTELRLQVARLEGRLEGRTDQPPRLKAVP